MRNIEEFDGMFGECFCLGGARLQEIQILHWRARAAINIFKNSIFPASISQMDNLLPEFQPYKEKIPEFIIKLYHILEEQQYHDYLTWNGPNEVLIKQPKKMEEKVLPNYFRHRHLSSFIRQLNMYRFSKVVKLTKERNYMYFKNEHFRRGEMYSSLQTRKDLTKIKRNTKKSRKENMELEQFSSPEKSDNISIDQQLEKNQVRSDLHNYKTYVRNTAQELLTSLRRLEGSYPELKEELNASLVKCSELLQLPHENENHSFINLSESDLNGRGHGSERYIQGLDPVLFPSQCNF